MNYSYRDELYHHGIKGQKWGVRRYQNEDGSLTSAGLKRQKRQERRESYRRGKEIAKDRDQIYLEKLNKLRESSNEYQSNKKRLDELEYIYDLDKRGNRKNPDAARGVILDIATSVAQDSHKRHSDQLKSIDSKFKEKARKYTDKKLMSKYGDEYTKDLNRYDSVNTGIAFASTIATTAAMVTIASLMTKR